MEKLISNVQDFINHAENASGKILIKRVYDLQSQKTFEISLKFRDNPLSVDWIITYYIFLPYIFGQIRLQYVINILVAVLLRFPKQVKVTETIISHKNKLKRFLPVLKIAFALTCMFNEFHSDGKHAHRIFNV